MKYPYVAAVYNDVAVAVNHRDKYNAKNHEDTEAVVQRTDSGAWQVVFKMKNRPNIFITATKRHTRHLESELQRTCVEWFRLVYPSFSTLLFAVPNGGRRNPREAAIMKAEGTTAGVADLILFLPRQDKHALCIEMKTSDGRQSPAQKEWQQKVQQQGYQYEVVRNFSQFQELIENYI